jgi:phosphoribosyl-ATP pyrophosphohydrolase
MMNLFLYESADLLFHFNVTVQKRLYPRDIEAELMSSNTNSVFYIKKINPHNFS